MSKRMVKMLNNLYEDCEDLSLNGKSLVTEENLRDEYFFKLGADFIGRRKGEGLDLDRRPCKNRFLLQVGLMREDKKYPWAPILKWLRTIFRKHFSADFRSLIERGIATALSLASDVRQNFLDMDVNFDFIGPLCESIGVERQDLLNMKDLTERAQYIEVTNGLILELSNFITREKIAPVVIVNWLKCFNPDFCKTGDIKSAYKLIKPKIKKLNLYYGSYETRSNRRSAALQNLLLSPFELMRKVTPKFIPRKRMKREHYHMKAPVKEETFEKVQTAEPSSDVTLDSEDSSSEEEVFDSKCEVLTLLDVTMQSIQKLSTMYGGNTNECQRFSFDVLKNQYTLTCKEHVAMTMFERKLRSLTGEVSLVPPVLFLHHVANFLVAAHDAVEEQICNFEKELILSSGGKLGRDKLPRFKNFVNMKESATSRYIHMACDILSPNTANSRVYRKHWIAFCKEKNNPSKLELRLSNRFYNYMEAAAGLIHHFQEVGPFFSDLLLLNNDDYANVILESVSADANDPTVQSLVCVLAIVYCKIIGPFWQLMTSAGEYSLFSQYLLCLYQRFLDWSKDPSKLLEPEENTNVFLQLPSHETIFSGVFDFCSHWITNRELIKVCLKRVVKGVVAATDKHLKDYLPGGKFSKLPSVEASLKLEKCTFAVLMAKYPISQTSPGMKRGPQEDESEDDESQSYSEGDGSEDSDREPLSKEAPHVKMEAPVRHFIKKEAPPVKIETPVRHSIQKEAPPVKIEVPVRHSIQKEAPPLETEAPSVEKESPVRQPIEKEAPVRQSIEKKSPVRQSIEKKAPVRQSIKREPPTVENEASPVQKETSITRDRRKSVYLKKMTTELITSTVMLNGGPCKTKQDVDKLLLRFDGRPRKERNEALRCEIMYQIQILNNTDVNLHGAVDSGCHMVRKLKLALPRVKPGYSVVWAPKWMSTKQAIQQQAAAEQKESSNNKTLQEEGESSVPT